jgi:hypothetical protein
MGQSERAMTKIAVRKKINGECFMWFFSEVFIANGNYKAIEQCIEKIIKTFAINLQLLPLFCSGVYK